jgi:hypothetical protein
LPELGYLATYIGHIPRVSIYFMLGVVSTPLQHLASYKNLTDLGGKVVAFRRQNRVRQLKDTWPIGFLCLYMSVRSIGR